MKKINILLIEDNRLLREGIAIMLKKQPDMNAVAAIGSAEGILKLLDSLKPDIVLLDLGLRSQSSLTVVKLCKDHTPEINIIVMALIPQQNDILEFVKAKVSGFILKDANTSDFFSTLRKVADGIQVLPPDLTGSLFTEIIENVINVPDPSIVAESVRMTKRESQVIELVSKGATNKEIAESLHLSPFTVKSHIHNILEKLSLNTRVQVARYAFLQATNKPGRGSATPAGK